MERKMLNKRFPKGLSYTGIVFAILLMSAVTDACYYGPPYARFASVAIAPGYCLDNTVNTGILGGYDPVEVYPVSVGDTIFVSGGLSFDSDNGLYTPDDPPSSPGFYDIDSYFWGLAGPASFEYMSNHNCEWPFVTWDSHECNVYNNCLLTVNCYCQTSQGDPGGGFNFGYVHTFNKAGSYLLALRVKDNEGTWSRYIELIGIHVFGPIATFDITGFNGRCSSVTFNGKKSSCGPGPNLCPLLDCAPLYNSAWSFPRWVDNPSGVCWKALFSFYFDENDPLYGQADYLASCKWTFAPQYGQVEEYEFDLTQDPSGLIFHYELDPGTEYTITLSVTDSHGITAVSEPQTITATNNPPQQANQIISNCEAGVPVSVILNNNDPDTGDFLRYSIGHVHNGVITRISNNQYIFTPIHLVPCDNTAYFDYKVSDGCEDLNDRVTFEVDWANQPPQGFSHSECFYDNTYTSLRFSPYFKDSDCDELEYSIVAPPMHGTLEWNGGENVEYTLNESWEYIETVYGHGDLTCNFPDYEEFRHQFDEGTYPLDQFTYKATDGMNESNVVRCTIWAKFTIEDDSNEPEDPDEPDWSWILPWGELDCKGEEGYIWYPGHAFRLTQNNNIKYAAAKNNILVALMSLSHS